MRAAEIAPAHYLGHLGLPSYPRPAVGPKFKRGAKFVLSPNFKQARPISVQKSKKQARPRPKHDSPQPVRFPIRTPRAPKLPLHQPRNPNVLCLPPHPTHQPPPPPSRRSRYPDVVVHLVVAAPTTASSTGTGFIPRPGHLLSKVFFPAADSHRTRSTLNVSAGAYTAPQERWYFISPQLFDLNQKIDLNLVTLLSFQLLEFSS